MAGTSFSKSLASSRASPSSYLSSSPSGFDSIDPILHLLHFLPYGFLHPPRLSLSSLARPSPMTIFFLILLTYFAVFFDLIYDIIVEPPRIGSTQDRSTDAVRLVVFLPGCINGQYIIEGLSSGFMFVLDGIDLIIMDLSLDHNRAHNICTSFIAVSISTMFIAYAMSMLFIFIKILDYLW